ncbi:MAG: acyl-CoA dehydrogenase domain-containing protein [Planctomycetota bacterium]|nr:MAG: acyl-CoA dehydrogenase domain-containing protein [Planctomycetota bacterium]
MNSSTPGDFRQQREQQMKQAEELLASVPERLGIGKGLFWGKFVADWIFPYPRLSDAEQAQTEQSLTELKQFCDEHLDPERIDREADIPRDVIDGLARLGVLGMTASADVGGRGVSQMAYCKLLEEIGGRCSATSIFVNAHHSIGIRAVLRSSLRSRSPNRKRGPMRRTCKPPRRRPATDTSSSMARSATSPTERSPMC